MAGVFDQQDDRFDCARQTADPDRAAETISANLYAACYQHTKNTLNVPILEANLPANQDYGITRPADNLLAANYMAARDAVVNIEMFDGQRRRTGQGSGFFVTEGGLLATDLHVVNQPGKGIMVTTADGRRYNAKIHSVDKANDIALLAVENDKKERFRALPLGSSNLVDKEPLMAIGHPKGWEGPYASPGTFDKWVTFEEVYSGPKSQIPQGMDSKRPLFLATMHTEPGNSGGPIIDREGRVVGIVDLSNSLNRVDGTPVEPLLRLLRQAR